MPNILTKRKKYSVLDFDSEQEFEDAVIQNADFLFGKNSIYIDLKKRMGRNLSYHKGVPDAYLIDFFDNQSPQLYFVENELASHDVYSHIIDQLSRFNGAIISSAPEIRDTLLGHINSDKKITKELTKRIKDSPFKNIEELMIYLTEKNDIKIALVINEETADLNLALKVFRNPPDVAILQRYNNGRQIVYYYEPMRDEVQELEEKPEGGKDDFDTVVCAAFEDGFKRAYVQNNAWWAIRLSQKAREKLKYLAIYEKTPKAVVRHVAEIEKIEPYRDSGKYIVYLKNKKRVGPIKLDETNARGVAPQGPRFTTFEKLKKAKKISELWK